MSDGPYEPDPDPDRVACLREVARDLQGHGTHAELIGALLYRVSDIYDPDEDATPKHVYTNMRAILLEKETDD